MLPRKRAKFEPRLHTHEIEQAYLYLKYNSYEPSISCQQQRTAFRIKLVRIVVQLNYDLPVRNSYLD